MGITITYAFWTIVWWGMNDPNCPMLGYLQHISCPISCDSQPPRTAPLERSSLLPSIAFCGTSSMLSLNPPWISWQKQNRSLQRFFCLTNPPISVETSRGSSKAPSERHGFPVGSQRSRCWRRHKPAQVPTGDWMWLVAKKTVTLW